MTKKVNCESILSIQLLLIVLNLKKNVFYVIHCYFFLEYILLYFYVYKCYINIDE